MTRNSIIIHEDGWYSIQAREHSARADPRTQLFLDWMTLWEAVCVIEGIEFNIDDASMIFLKTMSDTVEELFP